MSVRVYKVGGPALEDPSLIAPLADEIRRHADPAVLVHGGGRHVDRMLRALGIESRFIEGRRETSPEAMEVVEMVLSGLVNKALAAGLSAAGVKAVGLSGRDAGLIRARLEPGLGRVGTPEAVDVGVVQALLRSGLLPVIAPVSNGPSGEPVNVNADEAALGLARALSASRLVYLSDVDGVRIAGEAVASLSQGGARAAIADGTIQGGMALKVRVALEAAEAGVPEVVIAGKARLLGGFAGTRIVAGTAGVSALLGVYERDIVLKKGKGARLFDAAGNSYLDFAAGIGVNGLGYGDRKLLAAIRDQAKELIHVSNLFHNEPATRLAERLTALAFPSRAFFSNSGTEAWEAALKFARRIGRPRGRFAFVAFERAFHGRTIGSLSTTWSAKYRDPFEPLMPGVTFCAFGDLDAVARAITPQTAAVCLEPVQGEGGIRPASPEFLRGLRQLCLEQGVLLLLDEVQCGLGRTGKLFAHQHAGITPDILTLAKPLGGGIPMGATLLRSELCDQIHVGDHGSTFGGNPIAAAASNAVLDRLTARGFVDDVAKKGAYLMKGLARLKRRYPQIAEVRGLGLMIGVEFAGEAAPVLLGLRERFVLATKAGDKVLRLLPPLVVKRREIKLFLAALESVLQEGKGA